MKKTRKKRMMDELQHFICEGTKYLLTPEDLEIITRAVYIVQKGGKIPPMDGSQVILLIRLMSNLMLYLNKTKKKIFKRNGAYYICECSVGARVL